VEHPGLFDGAVDALLAVTLWQVTFPSASGSGLMATGFERKGTFPLGNQDASAKGRFPRFLVFVHSWSMQQNPEME
jgi:hypothetical protein